MSAGGQVGVLLHVNVGRTQSRQKNGKRATKASKQSAALSVPVLLLTVGQGGELKCACKIKEE